MRRPSPARGCGQAVTGPELSGGRIEPFAELLSHPFDEHPHAWRQLACAGIEGIKARAHSASMSIPRRTARRSSTAWPTVCAAKCIAISTWKSSSIPRSSADLDPPSLATCEGGPRHYENSEDSVGMVEDHGAESSAVCGRAGAHGGAAHRSRGRGEET